MPSTNETPQLATVMLPGNECAMFIFPSGVATSAVKHSAAYKPNQQINGKERKGSKEE